MSELKVVEKDEAWNITAGCTEVRFDTHAGRVDVVDRRTGTAWAFACEGTPDVKLEDGKVLSLRAEEGKQTEGHRPCCD